MSGHKNTTRRAMEGDWVEIVGNRIHLVATKDEVKQGVTELYRHFDANGKLLYVGISLATLIRLSQHRSKSHWFDYVARIEIERFLTRKMAEEAERRAIWNERPKYNKAHQ